MRTACNGSSTVRRPGGRCCAARPLSSLLRSFEVSMLLSRTVRIAATVALGALTGLAAAGAFHAQADSVVAGDTTGAVNGDTTWAKKGDTTWSVADDTTWAVTPASDD